MKQNGVKFIRVPRYRPASNGAADRSVQTTMVLAKQVLDGKASKLSLEYRLANFLKPQDVADKSAQLGKDCSARGSMNILRDRWQVVFLFSQSPGVESMADCPVSPERKATIAEQNLEETTTPR